MRLVLVVHLSLNQMKWLISGTLNFTGHEVKMFCNSTGWMITKIGSKDLNDYYLLFIIIYLFGCYLILQDLRVE